MPRPTKNNKDVNPYEQQRNDQIEMNNQRLDALNLPRMNSSGQNVQPSKRAKVFVYTFIYYVNHAYFLKNIS